MPMAPMQSVIAPLPVSHYAHTHTVSLIKRLLRKLRRSSSRILKCMRAQCKILSYDLLMHAKEPCDFFKACTRRDCDHWIEATYAELQYFIDFDVWEPVDLPPNAHVIKSKIIYKLKLNDKNEPLATTIVRGKQD